MDTPKEKKRPKQNKTNKSKTQILLLVSYAEMQSNCISSEIYAFPLSATGTPQYKNSI